jgi:Ca2+-binding RTX toxin-like protein
MAHDSHAYFFPDANRNSSAAAVNAGMTSVLPFTPIDAQGRRARRPARRRRRPGAGTVGALLVGLGLALLAFAGLAEEAEAQSAVSANFDQGVLRVRGTAAADQIVLGRNGAGTLVVNGGAVTVTGGPATVVTTSLIRVEGLAGPDVIALDQANGALPAADLRGGDGNDTVTGGSGTDTLDGGAGADVLDADGSVDTVRGGTEADRIVWNLGDGSDEIDGGSATDRVVASGSDAAQGMDVSVIDGRAILIPAGDGTEVVLDGVERLDVALRRGADRLSVGSLAGADLRTVAVDLSAAVGAAADGVADSVSVTGTVGADVLRLASPSARLAPSTGTTVRVVGAEATLDRLTVNGLEGADVIDAATLPATAPRLEVVGGPGADRIRGGAGGDHFFHEAGDGSDRIDGGAGADTVQPSGTGAAEQFTAAAVRGRVRLTAGQVSRRLDLGSIEILRVRPSAGVDGVTLGDLSTTALSEVTVDLQGSGSLSDAVAEVVTVTGTPGRDSITTDIDDNGVLLVAGAGPLVRVVRPDAGVDRVRIAAGAGADRFVSTQSTFSPLLTLLGGPGNDDLVGGRGSDLLLGGTGRDVLRWGPGGGNDRLDGNADGDRLHVEGSNAAEQVSLTAVGARVELRRDIAAVDLDIGGVERLDTEVLGGPDVLRVGDLAGTPVTQVTALLAAGTGDDAAVDRVEVAGTARADRVTIGPDGTGARVAGLTAAVVVQGAFGQDQLDVLGLNGVDRLDGATLPAGRMALKLFGGRGDDVLVGSAGSDHLDGGEGIDRIDGRAGTDTATGGEEVIGVP